MQINEINYKAKCYKMKALHLTYSTMSIVNQREKARGEKGEGQARAKEKVSGDQESTEQCFTIPFIHKNNQSDHIVSTYD